jgi:hypothetical protein
MHGTHNAQHSANQNIETEDFNNNKYDEAHHTQKAHLDKQDQNQDTQNLADQNIIQGEDINNSEIYLNEDAQNSANQNTIEADDLKNDSYFDIEYMPVIIDNFTTDEMPLSNFLASTSEKCVPSKSIYVIPSTSTSDYMNSILTWPKRKGKNKLRDYHSCLLHLQEKKQKQRKNKREESLNQRRKTEGIRKQQKKQQKQQNKLKDKLEKKGKKIPGKKVNLKKSKDSKASSEQIQVQIIENSNDEAANCPTQQTIDILLVKKENKSDKFTSPKNAEAASENNTESHMINQS